MRNELIEGVLLGIGIGLAVIAIRTLMAGASSQAQVLALVLVGAALCIVQLVLTLRSKRREAPPTRDAVEARRPLARRRSSQRDPFARELTREWTGLDERVPSSAVTPPGVGEPAEKDAREWLAEPDERPYDGPA